MSYSPDVAQTGECGADLIISPTSGSFFPVGDTPVTITTSAGGSCTFSVRVVAAAGPTISCNLTQTIPAADGECSATATIEAPSATPVGVRVEGARSDGQTMDEPYPAGSTVITWTATDSEGRTATCQQTILVTVTGTVTTTIDVEDVDIVTPPGSFGSCSIVVGETELGTPKTTGNCTVNVTRSGVPSGNVFPIGTTTITYLATDATGVTATATQTVTVTDGTAPIIFAPPDASYTCRSDVPAADSSLATGPDVIVDGQPVPGPPADNCSTTTVTVSDASTGAGSASDPLIIARTYTATDAVGNSASVTQTIKVVDDVPPSVSLNGDALMTVECHTSFTDPGATATDNCAGATVTPTGDVDVNTPGNYTITYTATDAAGNPATATRTVSVVDTIAPVITMNGDNPMTVECHTGFTDPGATASDTCDNTVSVSGAGTVDPNTVGVYTITYTASDDSGNAATPVTRTVNVVDTTAPEITVNGDNPMTVECHDSFTDPGATAEDGCAGSVPVTSSGSVDVNTPGSYTITYSATDGTNPATRTRTVNVVDTTAPVIAINGATPMTVECHTGFTDPGATATDSCDSDVAVSASGTVDANTVGVYTITYAASDDLGNTAAPVTRTVNVVDTTKPVIALNGATPMTVECHTGFTDPGATATDSCDSTVAVSASGTVDANTVGVYTITYTASDDSGNAATPVTRTVNVVDTTAPTITCPTDIVVHLPANSTANSMPVSYPAATATDACATPTVTTNVASGSAFPVGTTTVTATATDPAGNSSTCSFTITVLYNFTGFFSPVNNLPVINNVNAGRSIPLKFSLSGNKGLGIFPVGSPASQQVTCNSSAPISELEGTETPGGSTLTYSPDQYHYNWKTEQSWAGTCRQLVVTLKDGSTHTAMFKFK